MKEQVVLSLKDQYLELDRYFADNAIKNLFLVCDESIRFLKIDSYFDSLSGRLGIEVVRFYDFQPNPLYESIVNGVERFHECGCDAIAAVGGGSAMDVAKCIKLYSNMDPQVQYLSQTIVSNNIPFLAMPTTAGTGSEATRYAVIYYEGEKQSISDYSCIPDVVLMDSSVLITLPIYQKKSTMLDALCHAMESFWSVNSTDESKRYSREAIRMILEYKDAYLDNLDSGNAKMLDAAHIAGQAINITQTTAGHAMCYKLTSLYGIAHGHAAALCVTKLFPYMILNIDKCIDPRGETYLKGVFDELAGAMGCVNVQEACEKFENLIKDMEMSVPSVNDDDYATLKTSVNPVRLKNNPIQLNEDIIDMLYHQILAG